jgi:hypothetical protein
MSQVLKIGVITGTHTERVQPGDLITAEFMNKILARLDAIEDRLANIEESLGNIQPPQPTFTMPTTFFPTLTFHPTFTLPSTIIPTFTTFFPTLTQTFFPTFLTPTLMPTGGFNTFVATLVNPTQGMNPTLGMNTLGMNTLGMNTLGMGGIATMGMGPSLGGNIQPSASILPAGSAIFHPETDAGALPGIGANERTAMSDAGIRTVQDVSNADPKALAGALKTNVDNANVLIGIAKNVMGGL